MGLGCCNAHDCERTTPIYLMVGEISGRVYVVTRATVHKQLTGTRAVFRADERHDITDQFTTFIRDNPGVILDNPEIMEALACD